MSSISHPGPLLIVGGGEDKQDACAILRQFIALAGGDAARVAVLTAATNHPYEAGDRYLNVFHRLGVTDVHTLHIQGPEDAASQGTLDLIEWATGLYIIGGSQYRLVRRLTDTPALAAIRARHAAGLPLGGTSAGAHAMSDVMLLAGQANTPLRHVDLELGPGLGFLPGAITETHFSQRGRLSRLLAAVAHRPSHLGLGLDEDTALLVQDGEWRVIGAGALTVLDASAATVTEPLALRDITLHTFPAGQGVTLDRVQGARLGHG